MNYYNNGSFFVLLLVVLQVSTNSPFLVASDPEPAEAVVSLDTGAVLITDSPSSNSTPDSDTSDLVTSDEREGLVLPDGTVITDSLSEEDDSEEDVFCFEHNDCEPRDSFFCLPGFGVCQEKLGLDEFCENSEWCKEPLTCLDGECVQISTTRFGGALCNNNGDCNEGFFCKPNNRDPKIKLCTQQRADGKPCQKNIWCIKGKCKDNICGEGSGDDVGPVFTDVGPAYGSGDDARILGPRNSLGPRNGLNKKCNNHKDCGKIGYCCNPVTMGKTGSFKRCEPRRKEGESCDGNDKWPNRICKNGLKCKKCNGLKCICCNPKEKSCV